MSGMIDLDEVGDRSPDTVIKNFVSADGESGALQSVFVQPVRMGHMTLLRTPADVAATSCVNTKRVAVAAN